MRSCNFQPLARVIGYNLMRGTIRVTSERETRSVHIVYSNRKVLIEKRVGLSTILFRSPLFSLG